MTPRDRYGGLLVIGDPHLEGRQPGFRKDDYPRVILEKLQWCLERAREEELLPVILGDLFDKPRDNPTWMLCELMDLLDTEIVGVYGNHDCADPVLNENDSLSLLMRAGRLRLVSGDSFWRGEMGGRDVVIAGSSYREPLPTGFDRTAHNLDETALVVWLAHHDIGVPGYEGHTRMTPRPIPGVDFLINGHIHRRLETVEREPTTWLTPGNISRRVRGEATREHVPSVLEIRVEPAGGAPQLDWVNIPHASFEEVFHEAVLDGNAEFEGSAFVAGLRELMERPTAGGAGLLAFIEQNVDQLDDVVADEIRDLAREVTENDD